MTLVKIQFCLFLRARIIIQMSISEILLNLRKKYVVKKLNESIGYYENDVIDQIIQIIDTHIKD